MSDNPRRRPRRHHVFFLRHCVRSVTDKFTLNLESETGGHKVKRKLKHYIDSPLPNWNTRYMWCAPGSRKILKGTGKFMMRHLLRSGEQDQKIRFRIVSDKRQRDVDTAVSIASGLTKAAKKKGSVHVDGLSDIELDKELFRVFKTGTCEREYTEDRMIEDKKARMAKVPAPNIDLHTMLERIQTLGGIGSAGPLTSLDFASGPPTLNSEGVIKGPGGSLMKVLADTMFFSRATGGIEDVFLPDATLDDVYSTVEWANYIHRTQWIDNPQSVSVGVVMAETILKALESRDEAGDYDTLVTIFSGHDSNIFAIGTALGLQWNLGPPYNRFGDCAECEAAPPGSGMHFINDFESGKVGMSYVYPVYLTDSKKGGSHYHHNSTGILETTPLVFKPNWIDGIGSSALSQDGTMTWIDSDDAIDRGWIDSDDAVDSRSGGINVLKQRLQTSLENYPEAVDCYNIFSNRSDALETVSVAMYVANNAPSRLNDASVMAISTFVSVFSPLEFWESSMTIGTGGLYLATLIMLILAFHFLKLKISAKHIIAV